MKKSIIINIISWLGISLLLFFYLERQLAFHYFYIEQFRLFRFNQDYALQLFSHPGGISEYIASFLIQYFIHPHIGPLIMTCLFLCIGIGVQNIWRKLSPNLEMPLAYLMPGILLLLADMDFNHHLEGILAYASGVDTQFIHPHPFPLYSDSIHGHRLMAAVLLCRSGIRSGHTLCYFL